jgi:glycosyltransferase involved in cell wall biosynthesis
LKNSSLYEDKSDIKITIGITAYKVGNYLQKALNSVINQSSNEWKGILVLDGENDNHTKKIYNNFVHPKFKKYSFTKNRGPFGTRTKAIELSDTEWYLQLDGDDYLPQKTIELLMKTIKKNLNSYYIYGNCLHFDDSSSYIKKPSEDFEDLCFGPLFNAASPIKKDLYNILGGYTKKLFINADWDFWLKVYEKNIKGTRLNETIYARRNRNESVGNKFMNIRPRIIENIIKRHPVYFKNDIRKNAARYYVYKKLAGYYKAIGNRSMASNYAINALEFGMPTSSLKNIIYENKMPYIRYKIRRIIRYTLINISKLIKI